VDRLVDRARTLAEAELAEELPRRWGHVQAVAAKAAQVAEILPADAQPVVVAAAWLHDVGYASRLAATGFHPLDGARWLRTQDFDDRVATLVANHSCALIEANERGLADALSSEFPHSQSEVSDALWYADLTTGPDGQTFEVHERLAEIRSRYGPDDVVTRFVDRAEPEILAAVQRTLQRLACAGQPM
jgi:putative nucleotidyltransferase with HDIG domain